MSTGRYLCIDVGGTAIKSGIIMASAPETVISSRLTPTGQGGGPAIMGTVIALTKSALDTDGLDGVCISTGGVIDTATGTVVAAADTIPHYAGTRIKETVMKECGVRCEVENDVNCAALCEYQAQGRPSSLLCLTVGTGIGGAFIENGHVWHGWSQSACEVGYMHMPGGAFEKLASTSAMTARYAAAAGLKPGQADGRSVIAAYQDGDPKAIAVLETMCDVLGMGISNICFVLNPQLVVLGGGIMARCDILDPLITKALDRYMFPNLRANTKLTYARCGNQAGMIGAYQHFVLMSSKQDHS